MLIYNLWYKFFEIKFVKSNLYFFFVYVLKKRINTQQQHVFRIEQNVSKLILL